MIKIGTGEIRNGIAVNSILLMAVRLVTAVLGLIVTKLLSVNFSLQEYGTYAQALLVTSTAASISVFGLTDATNYFYNRTLDEPEQKKYISTIFTIQYLAGLVCLIIVLTCRGIIAAYFSNDGLKPVLILVAATPLLSNLIAMYQNLFVSIGRAKTIAVRNLTVSALRLCAVAAACFITNNIVTVLFVILFLDMGQVVYFADVFSKLNFRITWKNAEHTLVKEILTFSLPMAVYVLTNALTRDIDKYVVSFFSNTEALAIYTNAAKMLPFDMLTSSLITVLVPVITRLIHQKNYREAQQVLVLYLRIGYMLTCIFVGGAVAVANHLMAFLYDEKYISGLPVFIVYLFIDMIRFANVTAVLSGAGKAGILMVISAFVLVANAVFNVISYPLAGMLGPALTTLVLTVLMTAVLLHYGAKEIRTTVACLFNFKEMALIGCEILLLGGAAHYLSNFLRNRAAASLFVVLIFSYGLYLIALFGLNYRRILETFRKLNHYR